MVRSVGVGKQDFEDVRIKNNFYIDKTHFIKEWWETNDDVTLITRPRRFGKTLNMSMLEKFFSVKYAGRDDLFEGLSIWEDMKYRKMQGTYPVISLSFANVKGTDYEKTRYSLNQILENLYSKNVFLLEGKVLTENEKDYFRSVNAEMKEEAAVWAIHKMSDFLSRYYGKKVIILLDEYDTPMQEAYVNGYWDEIVSFTRNLFNSAFKTNPYLERAIMTGITRVSKESIFSDLNNLEVVTTTTGKYETAFGFTEEEVFKSLDEFGIPEKKEEVKQWYDGFTFGNVRDIYNPWSIINYLDKRQLRTYWANTSSNGLVGKLIREGSTEMKTTFEDLMNGGTVSVEIDEQIVYNRLSAKKNAVWSLLLASGYLKVVRAEYKTETGDHEYELALTNKEVWIMFRHMIRDWFAESDHYNDFIRALLKDDLKTMNIYMKRVAMETFSYFDAGKRPSGKEPERFYHGFVLGLIAELTDRYVITSNRESGYGRYDVMMEPKRTGDPAVILEFKIQDTQDGEKELSDTVRAARKQIDDRNYEALLIAKGIPEDRIRKYGFAFCGQEVLIGR